MALFPASDAFYSDLKDLGKRLSDLHSGKIIQASQALRTGIRLAGKGDPRVERGYPKYDNGKIFINSNRWFEDVVSETWEFHVSGYQVCEKWLKDRAGKLVERILLTSSA